MSLKKFTSAKNLFFVMIGVLVILVGVTAGAVVLGNKLLQKKTDKLISLKLDSKTLDEQQRSLVKAKKDIEQYTELEKIAKSIVPQEKDQARTVREIIKIAEDNDITISNIAFPSSTLGQSKSKTPVTGTTPTTGTTAPKTLAPPTTQVKPVEGISGVYQLEITVQTDSNAPIPYQKLLNFLGQLEQNRRTSQVTNIIVQPNAKDRNKVTFNLTLIVYIKP